MVIGIAARLVGDGYLHAATACSCRQHNWGKSQAGRHGSSCTRSASQAGATARRATVAVR